MAIGRLCDSLQDTRCHTRMQVDEPAVLLLSGTVDTARNGLVNAERVAFASDFMEFFGKGGLKSARTRAEVGVDGRHIGYLLTVMDGLFPDFAMSQNDIFHGSQAFQTDRATGMQFVVRDADFRTQTVFETVSETGRCVDHDR